MKFQSIFQPPLLCFQFICENLQQDGQSQTLIYSYQRSFLIPHLLKVKTNTIVVLYLNLLLTFNVILLYVSRFHQLFRKLVFIQFELLMWSLAEKCILSFFLTQSFTLIFLSYLHFTLKIQ